MCNEGKRTGDRLWLYRYAMEEYPSQLIKNNYWQPEIISIKRNLFRKRRITLNVKHREEGTCNWEYKFEDDANKGFMQLCGDEYTTPKEQLTEPLTIYKRKINGAIIIQLPKQKQNLRFRYQFIKGDKSTYSNEITLPEARGKKVTQKVKTALSGQELRFLRWRKRDIDITIWLYIILLIFLLAQTALLIIQRQYVIGIIKLIGAALTIGSLRAWIEQLSKEEEFFGWALDNYSKNVPIYEILRKIKILKKNNDTNKETHSVVLIADWIKNRPSVLFLLCLMISLLWIKDILHFSIYWEMFLYCFLYVISFPITSYWYFIKTITHHEKGKFAAFLAWILSFLFLFALPWGILFVKDELQHCFLSVCNFISGISTWIEGLKLKTNIAFFYDVTKWVHGQEKRIDNIGIPVIIILILALAIYFSLRRKAGKNMKNTKKDDEKNESIFIEKLLHGKKIQVEDYDKLSGAGQKSLIRKLLADSSLSATLRNDDGMIDKMINNAKNNEAAALAQELFTINRKGSQAKTDGSSSNATQAP